MSELLHSPDAELAALKARVARLERLEEQVYFQAVSYTHLTLPTKA